LGSPSGEAHDFARVESRVDTCMHCMRLEI
jgi:hypothetical protein